MNYPGLPKWPQMRVAGKPVGSERGLEIIRRTDTFMIGHRGNDRAWNARVCTILGLPQEIDYSQPPLSNEEWRARWDQETSWRERWGYIETEYVHNSWISCAFIHGPHGWCHPDGTISFSDNIGKWPSCEEIEADWKKLAEAFPFLDLEVLLMSGEGIEDEDEGISPMIGFIVKDGIVTPKLPSEHAFLQGDYAWRDTTPSIASAVLSITTLGSREREAAISHYTLSAWAEQVNDKA